MSIPQNSPMGFYHRERGDTTVVCGRWIVDNAGAQVVSGGVGFTANRTGAGDYLITFADAFSFMLSASAICQVTANTVDLYAQIGAFTPGAAGAATLQIRTKAIGVNTEVVGAEVCFEAILYGQSLEV